MRIKVRTGLDLHLGERPATGVAEEKTSFRAGLLGRDFPNTKFHVTVKPGTRVRAGDTVASDRHRREIKFTAPIGGTVNSINHGRRRTLLSIVIEADQVQTECVDFDIPGRLHKDAVRQVMLDSGLWTALKKRPFGQIPAPEGAPRALLVTAIDTEPLAPDPLPIIDVYADKFALGMEAMGTLCDGPIYLCRAPGRDITLGTAERVQQIEFTGPHPAGLPGTHIYFLCPIGFDGSEVWHIGYQDVIALGHLLASGRLWLQRVVTLAGPAVAAPRALTVPLAAATDELVRDELQLGPVRVISGSALSGHTAAGLEAFLGQRHRQVTVLPEAGAAHTGRGSDGINTDLGGAPGPLLPIVGLEQLAPRGVLPVPLMRALLVGDVERARDLGALELVEEDLALISYACPSKNDYGRLLRGVLDQLFKEAA